MRKVLFDAYAVLCYTQDEEGSQQVEDILTRCREGKAKSLINKINLGEVYYKTIRSLGVERADRFLETFQQLPVEIIDPSDDLIWSACRIKADHTISLADCFAVATAIRERAVILTGDSDFKKVEQIVQVEWI